MTAPAHTTKTLRFYDHSDTQQKLLADIKKYGEENNLSVTATYMSLLSKGLDKEEPAYDAGHPVVKVSYDLRDKKDPAGEYDKWAMLDLWAKEHGYSLGDAAKHLIDIGALFLKRQMIGEVIDELTEQ